jgi:hypothetical protein
MLQLFISLLVLSNVFHQTYAGIVVDKIKNATWGTDDNSTQTRPTDGYEGSDVEGNLAENSTIYNTTAINEKPCEAGGPSSLPLYQPANIFSNAGQSLGASPLVAGPSVGSQQQGQNLPILGQQGQNQQMQGFGNFGAGKGNLGAGPMIGAKGKGVGADFIPPVVGPPYPQYYGIGNIYTAGGGLWCEGCGGNLVVPPLPPIPPAILPPTYMWHDFPPLPPFPQIFTPAVAYPPAPVLPPPMPMQQHTGMGQQVLQNPGFGMKGQQISSQMPMQQQQRQLGQAMQNLPILGQQGQNQQLQEQNFGQGQAMQNLPILGQQGQNQQLQGQNLPILGQQGQNQQMQGQGQPMRR